MRLFLLPISTRRTLIYCERLHVLTAKDQGYLDKATTKASALWASWEQKDSGWQKKVVEYGNQALKRIPYEEWGLKSIPPLSTRRKEEELSGAEKVEVHFPSNLIPETTVMNLLKTLGTERQQLHKTRIIGSVVGMPIVAPFALVPVIPNLPFFYLVFRAYSHWKALRGSQHIEFLVDNQLIEAKPSKILNELYSTGERPFDHGPPAGDEKMVLHMSNGKRIAAALDLPELSIELDRAVWQVEKALQGKKELEDEKQKMNSGNADPTKKD